ncbi:MAG: NAD-binding protein, partial [Clostridia bacterium]|nr:NAD-binding protein [Clostridia bacterium]
MKIIIVGCGKVGATLAAELNEEGNDITVVDMQADVVADVSAKCDVMGVVGNGATHSVQSEAGVNEADLLIAVTGSDELNLLCCMVAKMNGKCQTIARLRSPEYSAESAYLKDVLGLAMVINPEQATAEEIARVLRFPSAIKIETFAKNRVELLKFRLPEGSILVGMSVKDVVMKLKCDILVCTVERGENAYIANGDFVFEERDVISLIASPKHVNEFFAKIHYKTQSVKDAILLGGGTVSSYLCAALQKTGISVKIIESREETCLRLSDSFPDACIIHSQVFDKEML